MAQRTHTIPSTSGLMTKRQIREPMYHENLVEKAENFLQQGNQKVNMVGVKGRSAFSCVVPELPLSAPVDYMHCVLLGVYASLLARHMKLLNKKDWNWRYYVPCCSFCWIISARSTAKSSLRSVAVQSEWVLQLLVLPCASCFSWVLETGVFSIQKLVAPFFRCEDSSWNSSWKKT